MAKGTGKVTDLTRGLYRRVYAGFLKGRRINRLSLQAEAWFWRVNAVADDFGNAEAHEVLVFTSTVGVRCGVSAEDVGGWLREMEAEGLIRFYESEGERFLHVVGFAELQPAGRNGKRVRKVPASPWDECISSGDADIAASPDIASASNDGLGESGGIRVNPSDSGCDVRPHSHTHSHSHSQLKLAPAAPSPASGEAAAGWPSPAAGPEAPPAQEKVGEQKTGEPKARASPAGTVEPPLLVFDCVGGRRSSAGTWPLTAAFVTELTAQFPAVDVLAEAKKALGWTRLKPENRKTADGMKNFLWKWMGREQNKGQRRPAAQQQQSRRSGIAAALEARAAELEGRKP